MPEIINKITVQFGFREIDFRNEYRSSALDELLKWLVKEGYVSEIKIEKTLTIQKAVLDRMEIKE